MHTSQKYYGACQHHLPFTTSPITMKRCRRFFLLLLVCTTLASLNFNSLWHLTSNNQDISTTHKSQSQTNPAKLLPRCPVPQLDFQDLNLPSHDYQKVTNAIQSDWTYYSDISIENSLMALRVRNLTPGPIVRDDESQIPHRLIFTHKTNLFNCTNSASSVTSPLLYNLAENAKATVNAYREVWDDLDHVFLTDGNCVEAVREVMPELVGWFNSPLMEGMYKADICRSAYLYLHGGYYFDVDILVIRPYVAPPKTSFVTVKGDGYPSNGFFQAFLAAEKGHPIILKSLSTMLQYLQQNKGHYLGPMALMEAWMQTDNITNATTTAEEKNSVHLLTEITILGSHKTQFPKLMQVLSTAENILTMRQIVPNRHGDRCQFSGGACNVMVVDEYDETLYFYSRILGTKWCGKKIRSNCTTQGILSERLKAVIGG